MGHTVWPYCMARQGHLTMRERNFILGVLPNSVAMTKYFLVFVSSIISAKQEFEFWIELGNHSDKY